MFSYLTYLGVRGVMSALQAVPYETSLRLGRSLSRLAYRLDGEHRRRTIRHLRMGYGVGPTEFRPAGAP